MGYTHYWNTEPGKYTNEAWNVFTSIAGDIIAEAERRGTKTKDWQF